MSEQSTQAAIDEVWQLFKETRAQFKETDARLAEQSAKTDAQIEATNAGLNRLESLFTSQWGKMLEALVEPAALALFQARGIEIKRTYSRPKSKIDGRTMELDVVLEDETDLVLIEVKSTLKVADVQEFLADLAELPLFFPRYAGMNVYAAVAGLTIDEGADRYANRRGLFVLGVTGEGVVSIKNDFNFRPANFGRS